MINKVSKGAEFSTCGKYRYRLWRIWDESKPFVLFIMLNPSTADENKNDPTVERCERYARSWGAGGLHVCNLFAYRATAPDEMKAQLDPIGIDNNHAITSDAKKAGIVICAWGNHGAHVNRSNQVMLLLRSLEIPLHYLSVTGKKEPGHPLYLKKSLKPKLINWAV